MEELSEILNLTWKQLLSPSEILGGHSHKNIIYNICAKLLMFKRKKIWHDKIEKNQQKHNITLPLIIFWCFHMK